MVARKANPLSQDRIVRDGPINVERKAVGPAKNQVSKAVHGWKVLVRFNGAEPLRRCGGLTRIIRGSCSDLLSPPTAARSRPNTLPQPALAAIANLESTRETEASLSCGFQDRRLDPCF